MAEKTEDKRFLVNTARAGCCLKVFSATRWRLKTKNAEKGFYLTQRGLDGA